jgi:tetratricopeptide (TPR) repeat protein
MRVASGLCSLNASNLTPFDPNATFSSLPRRPGSICLSRSRKKNRPVNLSRRKFLQYAQGVPLAFFPASLPIASLLPSIAGGNAAQPELQLHPEYRVKSGMEAILRKVPAGFDDFVTEKYQDEIAAVLREWADQLLRSPREIAAVRKIMASNFVGSSWKPSQERTVSETPAIKAWKVQYLTELDLGREAFLAELQSSLAVFSRIITAEFQIISIETEPSQPISLTTTIRFELVGAGSGFHREQRVGHWELRWERLPSGELHLLKWRALEEQRSRAAVPVFQDITAHSFGTNPSYAAQFFPGTDYWRTVLDGATGIDIYGHNGLAVGDIDGDGLDDIYVCQPAGLPNRLFRNRGDGTFEDVTDVAGVGVLENSACALFADIDNDGRQDLIVVRASGPLLFLNQGNGTFRPKHDAFRFANSPQGTFTGAAIADYDRDGWLDIYFCLYSYYQGADQYRYPVPYFDAENGPPNFLMRNQRDATFHDVTPQSGLDKNNTRFSFCCTWGDYNGDNWPDLYVVNDFGRKNLYRNNGNGTFTDMAHELGVEDVGAGMSGAWLDFDNDGREDLYVANMWTAAGIRVAEQDVFQKDADPKARALYRKHAMGNSLFQNKAGRFEDAGPRSGAAMGRWAWSSDAWDFNHDGFEDIYIANGMVSGPGRDDLNSFFWRQVVANSPNETRPNHEYEQAWNAINDLIRSDRTWSGFERNVFYQNNQDGTFSDISGIAGLDFVEDARTFALVDFDSDGRLEAVLKNRNSPQLRCLKNVLPDLPPAISFRLIGKKSNRDAIGAKITIETTSGRQTRTVRCGSGFLAQHTKELFFGLGDAKGPPQATIEWPSGLTQKLSDLPLNHRIYVEEGSPPSRLEAYAKSSSVPSVPSAMSDAEVLPETAETWLLVPVLAPDFSLPDGAGETKRLSAYRGTRVVLYFWSASVPDAMNILELFEQSHAAWSRSGLQVLAIDVDSATNNRYTFPVFKASPDVLAAYNLLFRQLFDRHRDMSVPLSFLLDSAGNIVKVYQNPVSRDKIDADSNNIPKNDAERLAKALPFAGLTETYEFERNYLSLGFVFYERGYFEQAQEYFAQALKNDPDSAEALYGLGSAYLQQQKPKEARDCFERALKLHANYPGTLPNCWNNLGILAAREGNYDLAIDNFQRALRIDPQHSIALQNLGSAYRQKKDWPQAKTALERALALNPDDAEANYTLGMVYAQQSDTGRAYDYLQKAIALRPAYPEALNNLGILYLRTRRPSEAVQTFEQAIRVAPDYDQPYLNLARVCAIEGDREKAKAVLRQLLQQHPDHAQAKEDLAQLEK